MAAFRLEFGSPLRELGSAPRAFAQPRLTYALRTMWRVDRTQADLLHCGQGVAEPGRGLVRA